MRVELGAEVRTRDGQIVGKIKHLIVEPETNTVMAVVIEKGFLFTDDVEVLLEELHYGVDGRIELSCTKEEYDQLSRFDRSKYSDRPPPNAILAGFPPVGVLWNATGPFPLGYAGAGGYPPTLVEAEMAENAPEFAENDDTHPNHGVPVVIEKGSSVYSADDHQIGEVQEVAFDVSTGRPISLVVRSGLIVHSDTQVPAELIQEVEDGQVRLNVTLEQFKLNYANPVRPAA